MKAVIEVSQEDLTGYNATTDEIKDWIEQAFQRTVDTWDGGVAFLDGIEIEIKEV